LKTKEDNYDKDVYGIEWKPWFHCGKSKYEITQRFGNMEKRGKGVEVGILKIGPF
jgi:hypothetical protein